MEQTRPLLSVTDREFDALVLAGGASRRLGGTDKCCVQVAGRSLLSWALEAVSHAERVVVVGPERGLPPPLLSAREEPPLSGPVAAIAAGVRRLAEARTSRDLVVVACDMPRVDRAAVSRLAAERDDTSTDVAVFVDDTGRRQYFPAVFGVAPLVAALAELGPPAGAAVRDLFGRLTVLEVQADPGVTADCDTWDDVDRSRRAMEGR